MLHHIEVSNFRALEKFRMERLGRVNLLVGTNNCGKTSILEAIDILMEQSLEALQRSLVRRGEVHEGQDAVELEIAHLFHGHRVTPNATFTITGKNGASSRRVDVRVGETGGPSGSRAPSRTGENQDVIFGSLDLSASWTQDDVQQELLTAPCTKRGGILSEYMYRPLPKDDRPAVIFITTEALRWYRVLSILEEVMLTPEEDTLLVALRTIEPGIERIASIGAARKGFDDQVRGGVAVKLAGQRVPIGSLGDGMWRLLGVALALVRARGGVLLVDEIDTGLHYSVLERMWRLVHETASRLDVQVFATTHSRDCYESLAAIAHPTGHDVTIQRIEREKPLAVAFSEAEILQAAKRGIEVR